MASLLARELNLDLPHLDALKIPVDLLARFPHWRSGSREGFRTPSLRLTLLPEASSHPLRALRLHVATAAGATPIVLTLLRDLQHTMDPAVRVVALMDPNTDAREFPRLARAVAGRSDRVQFHTMNFASIYARDNALAAYDSRGRPVLLVPRAFRTATDNGVEPIDARSARRQLGVRVVRSSLYWHGGNIAYDGETLVVGADAIAENATRLGLTGAEVLQVLAAELGQPITVLGNPASGRFDHEGNVVRNTGQGSYHIDLDVALLGRTARQRPVALVADLRRGVGMLAPAMDAQRRAGPPYLRSARAAALLADEYRQTARTRGPVLDQYVETLHALGYHVVRVPQLQTRGTQEGASGLPGQDFVYCNVLPGLNRGRESIHYTPWGIAPLDAAAETAFRLAGVRPVRVTRTPYLASAMMEQTAGLRCFCGTFP